MLRSLARVALADLRRHKLQTALIFVVLAAAVLPLTLAITIQRVTTDPFDRLMEATDGAHAWFVAEPGVDLTPIAGLDGVATAAGPFALTEVALLSARGPDGAPLPLDVLAQPADAAVGRPLVQEGRWPRTASEVALAPEVAHFLRLTPGDTLVVSGAAGPVRLHVVGVAVHLAAWETEADGLAHRPFASVLPEALAGLAPDHTTWRSALGVRLTDDAAVPAFAGAALDRLGAGDEVRVTDWRKLRAAITAESQLNVVLLRRFSVIALLAAGLVIANTVGGRILAQFREIGVLKAVGFTPANLVALYLGQHLAIGVVAGFVGVGGGALVAPTFEDEFTALLATTAVSPFDPLPLLLTFGILGAVVTGATLLPALRAARVPTVQAITVGFAPVHRASSRLARVAARIHLPTAAVLGLKDAFARPLRAWLTVAALALTVATLTFSLGLDATLNDLLRRPERWGMPFNLQVEPGRLSAAEVEHILATNADVAAFVGLRPLEARPAGVANSVSAYAVAGETRLYEPAIPEGRLFTAPGEAVAGQALLDEFDLAVGDTLRVIVDGRPVTVRIVGRHIDTEHDGRVLLFSLDTYRAQVDPTAGPTEYAVQLRADAFVPGVMEDLARRSGGQLASEPMSIGAEETVTQIRAILIGLNLVLLAIGIVNLLSTTMLGVRERFRDIGILKTLGLTPRQVVGSIFAGVAALAAMAVVVGIPLGLLVSRALFDELGKRTGVGAGLAVMPAASALALVVPVVGLLALGSGFLPARHAARLKVAEALRYE